MYAQQEIFPENSTPAAGGPGPSSTLAGGDEAVLVIGGGRSSMDAALYAARRQARVIWSYREWSKWFAPPCFLDSYGAK